jgi:hypothetical protein
MTPRPRAHRLRNGLLALLALAGLGGLVAAGAWAPITDDDPRLARLWKRSCVRLAAEGLAAFHAVFGLPDGGAAGDDPLHVSPQHPYLARIRADPRTRRFYRRDAQDVAEYAAMADFLRDAFEHGIPAGWHYQFHLLEMLDARALGARIACGEITRMLIQMVQASGGHGRRVQLTRHVVAEVWSREHRKWVAMDADYDVWFSDPDGTPLSVWEIHQRVREGRRAELVPHVGASRAALFRKRPEALYATYEDGFAVVYYAQWVARGLPTWHPERNPALVARAYFPEPTLEQRIYFRHLIDDPASLYAPPLALASGSPGP